MAEFTLQINMIVVSIRERYTITIEHSICISINIYRIHLFANEGVPLYTSPSFVCKQYPQSRKKSEKNQMYVFHHSFVNAFMIFENLWIIRYLNIHYNIIVLI